MIDGEDCGEVSRKNEEKCHSGGTTATNRLIYSTVLLSRAYIFQLPNVVFHKSQI
jgi:hypothetical protein